MEAGEAASASASPMKVSVGMAVPQETTTLGNTVQEALLQHYKYLEKIAPSGEFNIQYRKLGLYACLKGEVTIHVGGSAQRATRIVKKWTILRKLQKKSVYLLNRLQPRLSDPDFQDGRELEDQNVDRTGRASNA